MKLLTEHILTILGFALGVILVARMLREQNRPGVAMAWLLAIVLIPYIGVPVYLLFGGRKLKRMAGRKEDLHILGDEKAADGRNFERSTERILAAAGMPPACPMNQVELLPNGEAGYAALVSLLEGAKRSIHVTTFILGRCSVGRSIVQALTRKAAEGAQVRLLLDALGCFRSRRAFLAPLRKAGGRVAVFMPVIPLRRKWSANLRNHRKMVVVDGETALVGGMNLARVYMGPQPDPQRWLDTAVLIHGPAVADIQAIFASDWAFASGEEIRPGARPSAPALTGNGGAVAQIVPSGPDVPDDTLYEAILAAAMGAKERIWIVTPYFVPDEPLFKALTLQARLGRDIRILLPARSNHPIADLARGRFLRQLAQAGAHIFTYEKRMIHAKLAVFDHDVAISGSANLDMRSLYLNYEIALFMYSPPEVARVAGWMQGIMEESKEWDVSPAGRVRAWAEDLSLLISPLL